MARTEKGDALDALIFAIFKANGRLIRGGEALSKDLNLTAARWQILGAIDVNPRTVAQIARHFELTRQGVLWAVQGMIRDGLVELIRNPDHRRAKLVQPTVHGRALFHEVSQRQRKWANELAEPFAVADMDAAAILLMKLAAAFAPEQDAD
ncbi:MarR family transcriptional regulator [Sphingomonas sp. AOB5]|uniref:MarR family winged helix-turn-helix transcriptional regulator n=1 Tax=Sphingomonas sp. AOB5 TaxID=3034017 RepID=UPI0023F70117|nr:MarR family transcriptional regulator [Sphingomonas sp. AOB5]MDF7775602.1 MarR family transcriptional regulator [Sphingomonas sp. AOB5]